MKKLLLTSAIVGTVAFAAVPANAEIQLGLGGQMKGYVSWVDQDEATGADVRDLDIVRDTEIHFTGETTLDNGLTVGFHTEALTDGNAAVGNAAAANDSFNIQESYAYFAGNWGRVNFGAEDGAAYLLQVAAPSADSNVDGIRQYVNGTNYAFANNAAYTVINGGGAGNAATLLNGRVFDYDHSATGYADKITYITPVFSGFQGAASYTPDSSGYAGSFGNVGYAAAAPAATSYGDAWELAARYEGQFNAARITLGAGYSTVDKERQAALANGIATDDVTTWNVGANVGISAFNVGVAYLKSNNGDVASATTTNTNSDATTWVVGADYTTGPFVLGVSYYDQTQELGTTADFDTQRYAGGVTYAYGPGLSFRGSVSHINHDANTAATPEFESTNILLGTQISF